MNIDQIEQGTRVAVALDREDAHNAYANIVWRATHPNCGI